VNESRRLQGQAGGLTGDARLGETPQFFVHLRQKFR
jgi:hypothetical protein